MLQLAHVTGPGVRCQEPNGFVAQLFGAALTCGCFEEMLHQNGQVFQMLGKRRSPDAKHSEAIVEIRSKAALLRPARKRLMRCRHDPDIDSNRLVFTHTLEFSTLQKTQQLGLK